MITRFSGHKIVRETAVIVIWERGDGGVSEKIVKSGRIMIYFGEKIVRLANY